MRSFTRAMKALSDPNRVKIIKMLEQRDLCVCELRAALGLAQPTVSQHLKVLEEAGLVQGRKEKNWVEYRLNPAPPPYAAAMLSQLRGWLNDEPEVVALRQRLPLINRTEVCSTPKE
ncbi:MAG: ArsR/SmtB family transcription factor [Thermodesulfobacteriota bacterium]